MIRALSRAIVVLSVVVSTAGAATVFDPVARQGDPVPGQVGASGFSTNFSRPSINESGVVVFEGIGPVAAGIYVKRPGMPLGVLVDGTMASPGVPTFAVPGQPAGTAFSLFKAPLINDVGDVVFFASFSGGNGIFAANIAGGPIVKLADSTDMVPGFPTTQFSLFEFSLDRSILVASLNNNGDVVILGRFRRPSDSFDQIGLYATTVAGGPLVRLVDGTESFGFTTGTLPNRNLGWVLSGINTAAPALTDTGHVVFRGTAHLPATTVFWSGVFAVPLAGGTNPTIVALKFDAAPTGSATVASFGGFFGDYDVTDSGLVVFHAKHSVSTQEGLYASDVNGAAPSLVVDNLGGFAVPGRPAGVNFRSMLGAPINATGQLGFFAFDNAPTPSNGGMYATDLSAGAPALVINTLGIIPPGRAAPSVFNGFTEFASPAINDSGNMVIGANGNDGVGTIFGLYFFNACSGTLDRIADDVTAPTDLGGSFLTTGNRGFEVHTGFDVRQGHYESLNNSNQVAFLVRFSNFDAGIYVASIAGAGSGTTTITCPADLTVACGGDTSPAAAGSATAVDDCLGTSVPTAFTDVSVSACGGTETITRTWTAGSAASCDQIITTVDTTAPSLTIPADVTIECDASTDPSNTGQATASDTCDAAPAFTFTDVVTPGTACGQAKTIARTWTATDACGNTASAVQTITVVDSTPPVLTAPADVVVQCGTSTDPSSTGQASATDNCDAAPTLSSSDSVAAGTCPQGSTISRTWTATDACGNSVSATQLITAIDSTPPVLTLPADATVSCDADSSPAATGTATAVDNCDAVPLITASDSATAGACPQNSVITRTWTTTDACGNTASGVQTVNVVDSTPPVITLTGAGTVVLAGCVGDVYVEPGATATDNCDAGPIAVTIGGDTVDTSLPATFTILYDAADACGNAAAQVSRTVNVVDSSAPTFTSLPADLTVECQGSTGVPATDAAIVAFLNMAAATDACDPIVNITNDAPTTFPFGATTVTWTATDVAGNTFTASRVVTVADTTAPLATCPPGVTASADAACQTTIPDVTTGVSASDVCSDAVSLSVTQSPAAGTSVGLGAHTITVTVTDAAGNSGQCITSLTVVDDTAPTVTAPPAATIECDQPTDPSVAGLATAVDNCDPSPSVTFTDSTSGGLCPELSAVTRTFTATDAAGNAASASQSISIVDTTAPSITCPVVISTSGGFGGTVVTFSPAAVDACDPAPSLTSTPPSGSFFVTGVTSVAATAADTCANSGSCGFDVLVSCFGVNRAKIGTKDQACRGIESIEFTSMNGTEELISLFKAEEGSGGGVQEDTLPASIVVDDGVNGPVTVDTSCGVAIQIGDVFGPYTVSDIDQDFDDFPETHGNDVKIRGSFVPAVPFDLAVDDFTISIDDGQGNVASFTIPAGSFVTDGNPAKGKFKFEGNIGVADVKVKLKGCKVEFKAKDATNTAALVGTVVTVRLAVGPNLGEDTLVMEDKGNHLKFKRRPKVNCCPSCMGVASMQVTSDQGVLVFVPDPGKTKLHANTVVDDGVNGPVTIHTSCSQPIEVGDTYGAYTISELIKVFDGS